MDGGEQLRLERAIVERQRRLERADQVADDIFGRVMNERREPESAAELGLKLGGDALDEKTVLRHRERMSAARLSVPARDARKSMSDVFNLDVERRGIEQVESPSAQHALPGACAPAGGDEANDPCPFHFAQEARNGVARH